MPRPAEIQAIIEEAVAEVFAAALPGLRAEIVGRAAKEIEALTPAPGESPTGILSAAMASIQEASSQAEILRSLLEGEARFAGRVALFVVKGGAVNGWQGIGFEDNDIIKTVNLNAASGLAGRAIQGRAPAAGRAADFDSGFLKTVKPPVENNCLVLPLVVKEKVAALIYADAGSIPGSVDASALSVLTRVAALWLEVTAMRKTGAAPAEEAQAAAAAAAPIPSATPAPAPVEDELHKKAKRFAKLLVEEIKLYNQPRVAEGKHNRDLYDRLREDIEKSRATYEKRYGESPVAAANYFNQELIRVLADNDVSLMGASFPR
ncbi:MAG TPA: hypothetical protein VKL40_07555 [Candidatus Angelobacter sp.]|nr:hypothetical protein [Candidatus Angelobacter sp.]